MAYTFEQIFAADPSSPGNVASNGVVTIFAPGDASKTPLPLTTTTGMALANPIEVNAQGFGPAFIAPIDRVAWEGAGYSGFLTSYDGMKEEAVAARTAAVSAQVAAEEAAQGAAAPTQEAIAQALGVDGPAKTAVDASITEGVAPLRAQLDAVPEQIENAVRPVATAVSAASDPVAYINSLKLFIKLPARPAGTLLWPQAFSVDAEASRIYVIYSGSVTTGSPIARIAIYDLSGTLISQRDVPVSSGTSSEGAPWFRNAAGQLCFLLRPATNGVGYAIYNYDTQTLGPTIALPGGNYKSAVWGDYLYTCDANDSTNGVGRVFVWNWESVKAEQPVLVETITLESRNMMEKVQSFTVNAGSIIFSHGPSKGNIFISAYTHTGKLQTAFQFSKADFARALNDGAPGTIKNVDSYRHESEGAAVYGGKLLTGHIVDNNSSDYVFCIVSHNELSGRNVKPLAIPMGYDTGWFTPTLAPGILPYTESGAPRIRREGNRVWVDGAIKGIPGAPSDTVVMSAPGFGPSRQIELELQKSSSKSVAAWKVRPNGDILVSYSSLTSANADSWYPFSFSWLVG